MFQRQDKLALLSQMLHRNTTTSFIKFNIKKSKKNKTKPRETNKYAGKYSPFSVSQWCLYLRHIKSTEDSL